MHSYEDRIRAVELYIKLGKRVAATIHHLGYPTENAWHREGGLDLRQFPCHAPSPLTSA